MGNTETDGAPGIPGHLYKMTVPPPTHLESLPSWFEPGAYPLPSKLPASQWQLLALHPHCVQDAMVSVTHPCPSLAVSTISLPFHVRPNPHQRLLNQNRDCSPWQSPTSEYPHTPGPYSSDPTGGQQRRAQVLRPLHSHEKTEWSSRLLSAAWPSPGYYGHLSNKSRSGLHRAHHTQDALQRFAG